MQTCARQPIDAEDNKACGRIISFDNLKAESTALTELFSLGEQFSSIASISTGHLSPHSLNIDREPMIHQILPSLMPPRMFFPGILTLS